MYRQSRQRLAACKFGAGGGGGFWLTAPHTKKQHVTKCYPGLDSCGSENGSVAVYEHSNENGSHKRKVLSQVEPRSMEIVTVREKLGVG